jgi:2-polyprenyl-3-methyl-5-hydroxy-6-metoxy-1,4-benzoquinol methylase
MLEGDLVVVASHPWARAARRLAADYRKKGLAVANGDLRFSNLLEGPAQMLTGHPYRLWEYVSLFRVLEDPFEGRRLLDVGGAGSILPCLLAEHGAKVVSLDLQPLLVGLTNHVARVQGIDLCAEVADAVTVTGRDGEFDVVTCVSVLEHVPPPEHPRLLQNLSRMLKPGGVLYLTFDYGTYVATTSYRSHETAETTPDESLPDVGPVCEGLEAAGLALMGNDPRELPAEVLALKAAPGHRGVAERMALNRPPFDAATRWSEVGRYVARRLGLGRRPETRFARHNFFRLFARKE